MSNQMHNELRKEFQVERLILFSDAVFAIAITLLVLEIKIPEIHNPVSDKILLKELGHLVPKFIGYIISFTLIGVYWMVHHRIFGYVINFDTKLLRLNLFFLFFIALMPFSTGFYSEYAGPELIRDQLKVPMTFYVLNYCFAGLINYLLWSYISNPANKIIDRPIEPYIVFMTKLRSATVPLAFLLMLIVAYTVNVDVAVYTPLLIPITMKILRKLYAPPKPSLLHAHTELKKSE